VTLTSRAFETLLVLVERSERVVSKDELMQALWPDSFVEESNLTQHISILRKALGETPQDHRYILTFPGRGYRFAESVRLITQHEVGSEEEGRSPAPDDVMGQNTRAHRLPGSGFWKRTATWVGLAAIALAATVEAARWLNISHNMPHAVTSADAGRRKMLAVLPFQNLSNDPGQEYFSDGLTEETITDLGELNPEKLGVIARTSAMAYKHTNKTIAEIGRELGTDYVLEGSVRREGGTARVSAQLIRVNDQTHLWAHNYEREISGFWHFRASSARPLLSRFRSSLSRFGGAKNSASHPVPFR
jgi:TolB-like protein/DNA-binding winged helix-turn-helix (wHTH) protein